MIRTGQNMSALPTPSRLNPAQRNRVERFKATRSVDVHCHCLPGVDDGPASSAEAIDLCRALAADGFTDVVATPHQLGRYEGLNDRAAIAAALGSLRRELEASRISLNVHLGAEVRIDERLPNLVKSGGVLSIGDLGQCILLELPTMMPIAPAAVANHLEDCGLQILLAHAERYDCIQRDLNSAEDWIAQGIALQVNAPSLTGHHGKPTEIAAWWLLERGWASVIATDSHNTGTRRPRMTDAIELVEKRLGNETARRLCIENPSRLLAGEPLYVPRGM